MSSAKARAQLLVGHGVAAVLDDDGLAVERSSHGSASVSTAALARASDERLHPAASLRVRAHVE